MLHLNKLIAFTLICLATGCATRPGDPAPPRVGDEIVVAGRFFHTGTPVVLWVDPGGYDGYRVEKRFAPRGAHGWDDIQDQLDSPNRYGTRYERSADDAEFEHHRGGQWTLDELQARVDLFVMHYDVSGTSRRCFEILHDHRCLSVHFMIDVDGTVYQTLDLKERAWHAGPANDRSVGVEIANIGAYPPGTAADVLSNWYRPTRYGAKLLLPEKELSALRTPGFVGYSSRYEPVAGRVHGRELVMYDLTPQQYDALSKLTAALTRILPEIELRYPADDAGQPLMRAMTDEELGSYSGLIGHYHLTGGKIDPGPAFRWEKVVGDAREALGR